MDELKLSILQEDKEGIIEALKGVPNIPDAVEALKKDGVYLALEMCKLGYTDVLQILLAEDVDITSPLDKDTPLQVACRYNQVDIVDLLLLRGFPILPDKVLAWHEASPLYIASKYGNIKVIHKLYSHDPGLVKEEDVRSVLLYAACVGGNLECMQMWLTPGMDLNHPLRLLERMEDFNDCEKMTPLYAACKNGHKHVIEFLLENFIHLDFSETVCNSYPDIIGEFLQAFFVTMETKQNEGLVENQTDEEDIDELFQMCSGQLQDRRLNVLHSSWLLPYTVTLVELNINSNNLTELPSCLPWKFQNLKFLSAMKNRIKSLMSPPESEDDEDLCPCLEEINLSFNCLESLCEEIFLIPSVKIMNLSNNKLQHLVRSIHLQADRSVNLQPEHRLNLTDRAKRNSYIPKEWKAKSLRILDASHNALVMLPQEMENCPALTRLNISHNRLSMFPLPWDCPLSYLDLSHNQLERFPVSMAQYWCGSLRYLNISHNQLDEINEGIVKLNVLTDLILRNNKIERLPAPDLWECSHLHQLDLKHNKLGAPLETTPTKFRTFSNIRKAAGKNAHDHSKFIPEFSEVLYGCLKELRLGDNNLECVPPTVCNMKMLEVLDLSNNPLIKTLPKEIGKLRNCGMLKLKGLTLDNVQTNLLNDKTYKTRDVLDGFLDSLRNSKPYRKIKTIVLGKKDKGKTTLVHLLSEKKGQMSMVNSSINCSEVLLNKRKNSFPFQLDKKLDIKLKVWDVVGDEAYNLILHSLFTPHTLYLLVWDFWSIGDELDKIGKILYNIQASTPHFSVIIVGTFLDKRSIKSEERDSILENLHRKMQLKWTNLNHIPFVCPVSCVTNDGMDYLRTIMYETAGTMRVPGRKGHLLVDRKVPQAYTQMETVIAEHLVQLRENEQPLCLTQKEMEELIEKNKECAELLSPEEYTAVTKFLAESGSLLHFSDQLGALNTLYFLDPAWLCDILVHTLVSSKGKELLRRGSGKISRSEVKKLYQEDHRFPDAFIDQYIELLERFEIAVSLNNSPLLFFPSELPEKPPLTSEEVTDDTKKLRRLYRMAECPTSFWTRLLTRMMMRVEQLTATNWFHKPQMTDSIRILARRAGSTELLGRKNSQRGLQIMNARKTFCREWICVFHSEGSFKVEPVTFTGEESKNRLTKGVLITEVDSTEKFAIIGIIVDEIEDIIQDYYPGLLEPDEHTLMPRLERYAMCSTCFSDVNNMYESDVDHFTMEHCARMLVHDSTIRCPQGTRHFLDKLVPDFLMKELPSTFLMDISKLELEETEKNFLGGGVTGSVFKAKYNGHLIAVKVYRSDVRNKRSLFDSHSSDSGTATMSTQGSFQGPIPVPSTEDEEATVYENVDKNRRSMIDLDETESIKALREMRQEVALTSRLRHPCIISLIGIGFSPKLMMGLELAPLGSLRDLLDKYSLERPVFNKYKDKDKAFPTLFSKAMTFKFVYQIARGLNYLHNSGIIYKDLKSDNILTMSERLTDPVNLKLSDYGISKYCWSGRSIGLVGTPGYQAPEILDSLAYDEKVDIFAFAMVVYEILTGKRPYMEYENVGQITRAIRTEDKRPCVQDFNVHTQFPYMEDIMQKCWRTQASERPRAADVVAKRGMQNVHFLSQCSSFNMVDMSDFKTNCVLGSAGNDKKALLWMWDGEGPDRTCSILDLERSCPRTFRRMFNGPRVCCMACVGKNVWVGTEDHELEVYGFDPAGFLALLSSFQLDAIPAQMQAVHNTQEEISTVYVALDNGNLLQFRSKLARPRGNQPGRSVKRLEGFADHKTVVLRSKKIHCMCLVKQDEELWVGNSGHIDVIDCVNFKVVKAERISLDILCSIIKLMRGSEVTQIVESGSLVYCLLQNSGTILTFEASSYTCVGYLTMRERVYPNIVEVSKPIHLTAEDHAAYRGVDATVELRRRNLSSTSSVSSLSSRDSASSVEGESRYSFSDMNMALNESQASSPLDEAPPQVPPRIPPRPSTSYEPPVPPIRSYTNVMQRRPPIPPRHGRETSTLPGHRKGGESDIDDSSNKHVLQKTPSHSLPNIPARFADSIVVTSMASVRGSLWVGRSIGDICIVDVSQNHPDTRYSQQGTDSSAMRHAGHGTHGMVVSSLFDLNYKNRGNEEVNIELVTVGKFVVSAYKVCDDKRSHKVDIASWEAYNARDVESVESYWKKLMAMEKDLIERDCNSIAELV